MVAPLEPEPRKVGESMTIEVEERSDVVPLCPHCEARIEKLWCRRLSGFLGKRYVYFCPHCRKVVGISHRKGLLAG